MSRLLNGIRTAAASGSIKPSKAKTPPTELYINAKAKLDFSILWDCFEIDINSSRDFKPGCVK